MTNQVYGSRVGIVGDLYPARHGLKRYLLLFDQLGMSDVELWIGVLRDWSKRSVQFELWAHLANEIEYCAEKNLIFDSMGNNLLARSELEALDDETLNAIYTESKYEESARNVFDAYMKSLGDREADLDMLRLMESRAQFRSRMLAKYLRAARHIEASPIISSHLVVPPGFKPEKLSSANVVDVVLDKLPIPDDAVPWEKILEFRSDPATQGFLQGLRVWMTEVARSDLSIVETKEKLDWLLHQRRMHLKAHNMAATIGAFGATFVAAMEIAENIVKVKWGAAAKGIVSIVNRKADLLKTEIDSPSVELNYIVRADDTFNS